MAISIASVWCVGYKRLSVVFYLFVIDTCLNVKTHLSSVCKYDYING